MKSIKRGKTAVARTPSLRAIKRVVTKAVRKPRPKKNLAVAIGPLVFDEQPLVEHAPRRKEGPPPLTLSDALAALNDLADHKGKLYGSLTILYNLAIRMERDSALRLPYHGYREAVELALKTLREVPR
jgi:hypothetical protein